MGWVISLIILALVWASCCLMELCVELRREEPNLFWVFYYIFFSLFDLMFAFYLILNMIIE